MAKRRKTGEMPPWEDTPSSSGQTSSPTKVDNIIKSVADALSDDADVRELGRKLKIKKYDVDRALETNWSAGTKTSKGNVVMLEKWAKKLDQSERIPTLRDALRAAELIDIQETYLPIKGSTTSGQLEDEVDMDNSLSYWDTEYKTGPGYVLFINNFFSEKIGERKGAEADEKNIKYLFEHALKGYHLQYEKNVSLSSLQQHLRNLRETLENGTYKNFIFILGTHGGPKPLPAKWEGDDTSLKDAVQMDDDKWMLVKDIVSNFHGDKIPAMKDRPKVFIIQSCRGKEIQSSVPLADDAATGLNPQTENYPQPDSQPAYRPVNSDILIAYATSEGTFAWRHEEQGSWFVTDLCKVITEYYDKEDMLNILVRVNGLMVRREGKTSDQERITQMPCFLCTFTRRFMLKYPTK